MSTVQEIESALSRLSPDEMRQIRDWLEQQLEDRLEMTEAFAANIERAEAEMSAGLRPRTRG
ncbi:MAG: hypothetical protein H3C27_03110 [Opitutaceae bacterium]|nr:hypothetical protein [Opitutaceae bacterium]